MIMRGILNESRLSRMGKERHRCGVGVRYVYLSVLLNPVQSVSPMGHKKRKLSDLTVGDRNALLVALDTFQDNLDEDDEDLPSGLLSALGQFQEKLEVVKVCFNALCKCKRPHDLR